MSKEIKGLDPKFTYLYTITSIVSNPPDILDTCQAILQSSSLISLWYWSMVVKSGSIALPIDSSLCSIPNTSSFYNKAYRPNAHLSDQPNALINIIYYIIIIINNTEIFIYNFDHL